MTSPIDTRGPTLTPPKRDDTAAAPHQPPPAPRRTRPVWPLLILVAGALTVLGVWTLSQAGPVDEVVDRAQVPSAHDSGITMQLRQRAGAAAVQQDPWVRAQLREHERAAAQDDPWVRAQLRERERAAAQDGGGNGTRSP